MSSIDMNCLTALKDGGEPWCTCGGDGAEVRLSTLVTRDHHVCDSVSDSSVLAMEQYAAGRAVHQTLKLLGL